MVVGKSGIFEDECSPAWEDIAIHRIDWNAVKARIHLAFTALLDSRCDFIELSEQVLEGVCLDITTFINNKRRQLRRYKLALSIDTDSICVGHGLVVDITSFTGCNYSHVDGNNELLLDKNRVANEVDGQIKGGVEVQKTPDTPPNRRQRRCGWNVDT